MSELLLLAVGGGIALLTGLLTGLLMDWLPRRRRRKSLATAFLWEQRRVETTLRKLAEDGSLISDVTSPLHDELRIELDLFRPETVGAVLYAAAAIRDVKRAQLDKPASEAPTTSEKATYWKTIEATAALAIDGAVEATACLLREGGTLEPLPDTRAYLLRERAPYPPPSPDVARALERHKEALKRRRKRQDPPTDGSPT